MDTNLSNHQLTLDVIVKRHCPKNDQSELLKDFKRANSLYSLGSFQTCSPKFPYLYSLDFAQFVDLGEGSSENSLL